MTFDEYGDKLDDLIRRARTDVVEKIIVPAAGKLLANTKNRIIRQGLKTSGEPIGQYSPTPGYYDAESFDQRSAFKPQGKNSKSATFKNGNPRMSMYLPEGYKELRQIQGKETAFINYEYSGSTLLSYQLGIESDTILLGFNKQESSKIRIWLEERRGKTFYSSVDEIAEFSKEVSDEVEQFHIQIFSE